MSSTALSAPYRGRITHQASTLGDLPIMLATPRRSGAADPADPVGHPAAPRAPGPEPRTRLQPATPRRSGAADPADPVGHPAAPRAPGLGPETQRDRGRLSGHWCNNKLAKLTSRVCGFSCSIQIRGAGSYWLRDSRNTCPAEAGGLASPVILLE